MSDIQVEERGLVALKVGGEWRAAIDMGTSYRLLESGTAIPKDGHGYGN